MFLSLPVLILLWAIMACEGIAIVVLFTRRKDDVKRSSTQWLDICRCVQKLYNIIEEENE